MTGQQLKPIDQFKMQVRSDQVQQNLTEFMDEKGLRRFTAVTIRAVQENPDLLTKADRASLFLACQRAAQDKLMPDGREGALVMYGRDVQWQPMIQGIRKRLAEAGFDLIARVVHEEDEWDYAEGDSPFIHHKPKAFGKQGKVVGAYAIATEKSTGDRYRAVMSIEELEKVRQGSRGKNSPAWTKWTNEMYKKTVAKRLRKELPIQDDSLLDLIDRDNEQFDGFDNDVRVSATAKDVQAAVRAAKADPEEPHYEDDVLEGEVIEGIDPPNDVEVEADEKDPLDF